VSAVGDAVDDGCTQAGASEKVAVNRFAGRAKARSMAATYRLWGIDRASRWGVPPSTSGMCVFSEGDPIAKSGDGSALSKRLHDTDCKVKAKDEVTREGAGPLDDRDLEEFVDGDRPVATEQVGIFLGLELVDDAVT